jgi:hypothetical protein
MACFERALRLDPQFAEARHHRATIWLRRGDFEAGWPEYEWRWKCRNFSPFSGPQPRWDGSPLEGRTLLIQAEQGFGDTLQFVRYVPLVRKLGGSVVVQVQPPLVRLLSGCPGIEPVAPLGAPPPEFDLYTPLLSLPRIFGTTLSNIPAQESYLTADPALVDEWRQRLAGIEGFRVGIAWQGNRGYMLEGMRSIPLEHFAALAAIPNVRLISLQRHAGTEQLATVRDRFPVVDLGPHVDAAAGPFMDTAAIMKNLDLVVTSCTATPHLAGALRVPVWIALPVGSEWRWLIDREDSPWYPTMRVFRQRKVADWNEVFERIAAELAPLVAHKR